MDTPEHKGPFRSADVRRRFENAADSFDTADFVHRQTMDGLLERMQPMRLEPRLILDLGCATGAGTRLLAETFRRARLIGVDQAAAMLRAGRRKRSRFARIREVQGDAHALPFRTGAFDLIVANLSVPWLTRPEEGFVELARVLRPEGLLMFSTLGPDSLAELREAWRGVDDTAHVHPFADMHNTGDALVRAGLRDPVLDVERLAVSYTSTSRLFADLKASGARNLHRRRRASLSGKGLFREFEDNLLGAAPDRPVELTLELVYGHAWGAGPRQSPQEYRLDAGRIGRIRRNT